MDYIYGEFKFPLFQFGGEVICTGYHMYTNVKNFLTFKNKANAIVCIDDLNNLTYIVDGSIVYEVNLENLTEYSILSYKATANVYSSGIGYASFRYSNMHMEGAYEVYEDAIPLNNCIPYIPNSKLYIDRSKEELYVEDAEGNVGKYEFIEISEYLERVLQPECLISSKIYLNRRELPVFAYESSEQLETGETQFTDVVLNLAGYEGFKYGIAILDNKTNLLYCVDSNGQTSRFVQLNDIEYKDLVLKNPRNVYKFNEQPIFTYGQVFAKDEDTYIFTDTVWFNKTCVRNNGCTFTISISTGTILGIE